MVSKTFADAADPAVIGDLKARSWNNETLNAAMAWTMDNRRTGKDGALHFLQTRPDLWKPWVRSDVAQRVQASLRADRDS
jgi:glycine betaine/proline transport system substrate-binding protein